MLVIDGILTGIILGGIYSFTVLGVAFIYGISGVPQFAIGAVGVFAGFLAWTLAFTFGIMLAIVISLASCFAMGFLIQGLLLNPIRRRGGDFNTFFLITFSIALILTGITLRFFGRTNIAISVPTIPVSLGGFTTDALAVSALLITAFILVCIHILTERTSTGKSWKATSQNLMLAELSGINTDLVFSLISGIGFVLGGLTGVFWGSLYYLTSETGWTLTFLGFVIAVVGGIGNIKGGFVSALAMGLVVSFSGLIIGGIWQFVVLYVVFVLILLFFPKGVLRSERSI
jgi:branched-chain amino acid transport system permease protein